MYQPQDAQIWQGRQDSEEGRWFQRISCHTLEETLAPGCCIIGFASDEGVRRNAGRPGAAKGPEAFRRALGRLPYHGPEWPLYDMGNIHCQGQDLESAQIALGEAVKQLRDQGHFVLVIGGGHETAWGHYQALTAYERLHIINWDAHFDLRVGQPSSGTPFNQIAEQRLNNGQDFRYLCLGIQHVCNTPELFSRADSLSVNYVEAEDEQKIESVLKLLNTNKAAHDYYVSLCLDVFAQSVAPGVSAPSPLGLSMSIVLQGLRYLAASGKVRAFDIVELAPAYDVDQQTEKLAAMCAAEFIRYYVHPNS